MTLYFEIAGNQQSAKGNPIPYARSTQNSFWNASTQRYNAWKRFVVETYNKSAALDQEFPVRLNWGSAAAVKPIDLDGKKAYMHLMIHWHGGNHGDPDNIWKGIADALFLNDKGVAGSFDYTTGNEAGRVEVQIIIE